MTTTVAYTQTAPNGNGIAIVEWAGLTGGAVGAPMSWCSFADKTVQVWGTIGAAILIQGSNDPLAATDPDNAQWETLTDILGNPLSFSTHGMKTITEAPNWIRPNAGAGTTNAKVAILANQS